MLRCICSANNEDKMILSAGVTAGEFVYAVTAAEGIILSSLFIGHKQR